MNTPDDPIFVHQRELAEQAIGAALLEPAAASTLANIPDAAFPAGPHRDIAAAIGKAVAEGRPVEPAGIMAAVPGSTPLLAVAMTTLAPGGIEAVAAKLRQVAAAIEARRQMADYATRGSDLASAREELDRIAGRFGIGEHAARGWELVKADMLLDTDPADVPTVYPGLFDRGDIVFLIAQLKARKTWFLTNLALCLAAGRPFLRWSNGGAPLRVLVVQLEVAPHHFHRRLRMAARSLGIGSEDLGGRLAVWNGRGHAWSFDRFAVAVEEHAADVVVVDPLYLVTEGDENLAADVKPTIRAFAKIAEETGAAVVVSHHDAKGAVGLRDARDRGAGSNVLGRAADVVLTLSPHATEEHAAVVGGIVRNYAGFEPFAVEFDRGGFAMSNLPPEVAMGPQQAKGGKAANTLHADARALADILGTRRMAWGMLKAAAADKGLSDRRIRNAANWAISEGWMKEESTGFPKRRMIWTGAVEIAPAQLEKDTAGQSTQPNCPRKGGFYDA